MNYFTQRAALALACIGLVSTAWAQQMMPDRDVLSGSQLVVWGNNMPGGAANYEIDFGDGTPTTGVLGVAVGNGQSYMPATHTYVTALAQEDFTATLKINGVATAASVTITVINHLVAALTADQLLDVKINQAIEDGLRSQYVNQASRELKFGGPFASWSGSDGSSNNMSFTSLAVLAFENHGHSRATGDIYAPVVQAGLNFIFDNLRTTNLSNDGPGDPCAEIYSGLNYGDPLVPGPVCTGLSDLGGVPGYSTAVESLAIAGSGAPGAIVAHGTRSAGFTVGKTYLEVMQRLINTMAFAQRDGGWRYSFNQDNDGSTNGWNALALLDGQAFGVTIPAFVLSQFNIGTAALTLADGSMGYTARSAQNTAKAGIRLQVMSLTGVALGAAGPGGPTPQTTIDYINAGWKGRGESFNCGSTGTLAPFQANSNGNNFGCMYAMFNVFKGLKLYGVATIPNSSRADLDWHKEYQDYLTQKQLSPTTTTGGGWGNLSFSCCNFDTNGESALALLVLSATALILPDPVKFSEVGLSPLEAVNILPGDDTHTVTAHAQGACAPEPCTGANVPGATVDFEVLTGPNTGKTGSDVTDASGNATFTYTNATATTGTDTIQAMIGSSDSNIVEKEWRFCVNDLSARPKSTKVQLVWTDSGPARGYNVYRSETSGGPYAFLANTTSDYSTYLDSGLTNGTTYFYVVSEVLADESELCQSNEASGTPAGRRRR